MEKNLKRKFIELWNNYFPGAELPIGFFYTDQEYEAEKREKNSGHRCLISDLSRVRKGKTSRFDKESIGCVGGARYLGFSQDQDPNFDYFLSCGLPGKMEGSRYKKTPQLVRETQSREPDFSAPDINIVFKRWDVINEEDNPDAIIFFATADVLAGLFSLANFDQTDPQTVITPSCAGCASIVKYPYLESKKSTQKAFIGLFDISARPYIQRDLLTFSVPWKKFQGMVDNMEESFLITAEWSRLQRRFKKR